MSAKQITTDYWALNHRTVIQNRNVPSSTKPSFYSSQINSNAGIYNTTNTNIALDVTDEKPIAINKYNIPVGALVFIRVRNHDFDIQDFFRTTIATTNISSFKQTYTSPWTVGGTTDILNPTWTYTPSTTTGDAPWVTEGDTGMSPYYTDYVTGKKFDINVDETIGDDLQELYDAYNTNTYGGSGTFGENNNKNGLGMTFMRNKKSKGKTRKSKAVKKKTLSNTNFTWTKNVPNGTIRSLGSTSTTVTIPISTKIASTITGITCGPSTNIKIAAIGGFLSTPIYKIVGYKTVEDCLLWQNPVEVVQNSYTEEDLAEILEETGSYPELGQPFSGIIVDKFVPKLFTANGDNVDASHLPTLYKVLIDEKNVLWTHEVDIAPMQPKNCPLKEEEKKA